VFSNFLIGLREGLEATLVVGILVAYLVRMNRRDRLVPVWIGVAVAAVVSLGFAAVLHITSNSLSDEAEQVFAGVMSIIAVGFVTWMVFWMRRTARSMKHELHGKVDAALGMGSVALAFMAAVAVAREGLETALFLWTNEQAAGPASHPALGGLLGILVAIVIGYLIYRQAIAIDLAKFFTVTGALLIVIAAGVLSAGVHELQEVGWIGGADFLAVNISGWYSVDAWYGSLLSGVFNFVPTLTVLQVVVWFGYLVPTMWLFLRDGRPDPSTTAGVESASSADLMP
jgi:high-affinity iron transporter